LELWRLLAHNHWFTLNLLGYRVRLCARCSGYLLGFASPLLFLGLISAPLAFMDVGVKQLVFFLLAVPLVFDWVTQSWGMRKSSNYVRLATGVLMGLDVFLFSRFSGDFLNGVLIFVSAALAVTVVGLFGKARVPHLFQRLD
jgi:uncharacterized membrane protein